MSLAKAKPRRWRKKDWFGRLDAKMAIEYCGEKVCYKEYMEAVHMAERRTDTDDVVLRVYACPKCDYWHLTSRV